MSKKIKDAEKKRFRKFVFNLNKSKDCESMTDRRVDSLRKNPKYEEWFREIIRIAPFNDKKMDIAVINVKKALFKGRKKDDII
jgi:hypothetical protein